MRCFYLDRESEHESLIEEGKMADSSLIAQGVQFTDGVVVVHWIGEYRSTSRFSTIEEMEAIHGHQRKTITRWTDKAAFCRGRSDCYQDSCENVHFASIGGLDKRRIMVAPDYIDEPDTAEYLAGYRSKAYELFGVDWKTCEFGWKYVLTIGGVVSKVQQVEADLIVSQLAQLNTNKKE